MVGRSGRPNETLLAPRLRFTPNSRRTSSIVSRVPRAAGEPAPTVRTSGSMMTFSAGIPILAAYSRIRPAMARRFSASGGMPPSSSVRPMTAAPNSRTTGSTRSSEAGPALTALTRGLPGATASAPPRPAAITSGPLAPGLHLRLRQLLHHLQPVGLERRGELLATGGIDLFADDDERAIGADRHLSPLASPNGLHSMWPRCPATLIVRAVLKGQAEPRQLLLHPAAA